VYQKDAAVIYPECDAKLQRGVSWSLWTRTAKLWSKSRSHSTTTSSMLSCKPAWSASRLMNSKISDLRDKIQVLFRRRRNDNLHNNLTQNARSSDDKWKNKVPLTTSPYKTGNVRGGADKSLARPGRKQATANKLGIYSTYFPRSSIHFLALCSNLCTSLNKNSEGCPSNQVSAASVTSASEEKFPLCNCFFQSRE